MTKNNLVGNINKRKKSGTSRSKKNSTVSDKAYKDMKGAGPKKAVKVNDRHTERTLGDGHSTNPTR